MSLKNKFKTDSKQANEGVWIGFDSAKNADGSVPAFRLARLGNQNAAYAKALSEFAEKHREDDGSLNLSELEAKAAEEATLKMFVDTILLGWRHFQPNDDGHELEYNRENALAIFGDPDWSDFYAELRNRAAATKTFQARIKEDATKN